MRVPVFSVFLLLIVSCGQPPDIPPVSAVETSDLDRFWQAYDTVLVTQDSAEQLRLINELFIDPASPGQQTLFAVRGYTPGEYVHYINTYPAYYAAIRANLAEHNSSIEALGGYLARLRELYPQATPAKVYLGIGNLRTPGTTVDSMVLIGAEMAFGDAGVDVSELPDELQYVKNYLRTNPVNELDFLAVHEYVHTQQVESFGVSLLATSLREGSAEFIAGLASGKPSRTPALAYGREHESAVFAAFREQMFNRDPGYWLWTSAENEFGIRDLGYFVGHRLASAYYRQQADSLRAIQTLIELDYGDEAAVRNFVDAIGYFEAPMTELLAAHRDQQPYVTKIERQGKRVTVHFSAPMDPAYRGFDYGPLGEEAVLSVTDVIGFSSDSTALTFAVDLQSKRQQVLLTHRFRSAEGVELQAYLLETGEE